MATNNPNQLVRSKSLNDISNDSQILAFASGRATNTHISNQGSVNNAACINIVDPNLMVSYDISIAHPSHNHQNSTTQCSPYSIYNQHSSSNNIESIQQTNNHNSNQSDSFANVQLRNYDYNNQCSSNHKSPNHPVMVSTNPTTATATTTAANMFNLCNPLAMNLNGVTEQIGNLHL